MRPLLVVLLFLGAGLMAIHQSVRTTEAIEQKVEYRYLPLPLNEWMKEQQFSAFNVMTDMVETTQGYCGPVKSTTSTSTPQVPTDTPAPAPSTTPNPTESSKPLSPIPSAMETTTPGVNWF
jgi:hypothetical protein